MGIECKHNMVISMSGFTKCTMCKSYVEFVGGKHIVIDVKNTKTTTAVIFSNISLTLDSIITKINRQV